MKAKINKKKARRTSRPNENGVWLTSASALNDYLKFRPEVVQEIRAKPHLYDAIRSRAHRQGLSVPVNMVDDNTMHEGGLEFLVEVESENEASFWNDIDQSEPNGIIALDHIEDPRNLGAIVRTSAFFGIEHIIIPNRRQVAMSEAVIASSQGGLALTNVYVVSNLSRTLEKLKQRGYWLLGADADGEALHPKSFDFPKMVLTLGSEGRGLSSLVSKRCDALVSIPRGPRGFDSLNVSVACGILLSEMVRQFPSNA